MPKTRVLLVDDHELVRAGIRALLERMPGRYVVTEAKNGREALEEIKATHTVENVCAYSARQVSSKTARKFARREVALLLVKLAPPAGIFP